MAGVGLPHTAVREQVTSAIDLIVHQVRLGDGSRTVDSMVEMARTNDGGQVRGLYRRGGRLSAPADGRLADRIARLRREGPA
jgi:pilus assembly protein CpaF